MTIQKITELKLEIDRLREYIESDLCKKCEEMTRRLKQCEMLLKEYSSQYE